MKLNLYQIMCKEKIYTAFSNMEAILRLFLSLTSLVPYDEYIRHEALCAECLMTDVYVIRHSLIVSVPRTIFSSCLPEHSFCFVAQECVRVLACMCAHSHTCQGGRGGNCPPSFEDLGKIKIFRAVRRKYLGKP